MTQIPPPPNYGGFGGYGGYPQPGVPSTPPNNNLVWAILSTVLCCVPLGIVSIVKAAEVNNKWAVGDYQGAYDSADAAKKWAMWSAIVTAVGSVIYFIFVMAVAASDSGSGY